MQIKVKPTMKKVLFSFALLFTALLCIYSQINGSNNNNNNNNNVKDDASNVVNLTVYYETLCPDSQRLIVGPLHKAFNTLKQILQITFIPFGKCSYSRPNESSLWKFKCQHGEAECFGNTIHNCFIHHYPKFEDHFEFIYCNMVSMSSNILEIAKKCIEKYDVNIDDLLKCANSSTGNHLLHKMGKLTHSLNPPLTYVPTVTLNGVYSKDIQEQAEKKDIIKLICTHYKGSIQLPACKQYQKSTNDITAKPKSRIRILRFPNTGSKLLLNPINILTAIVLSKILSHFYL